MNAFNFENKSANPQYLLIKPTRFDHKLIRFKISGMQQDKKYSEMFEEIDREFFKDESVSNSNRFSST